MTNGVQQMVMITPIDTYHEKTKHIADENGSELKQCMKSGFVWYFNFQYHDGDDNGYYSIAEGFEAGFVHRISWMDEIYSG